MPFQLSRRARGYIHRVTGAVALFVWLFLWTAEICPPLHAWLHGGSIPDDDDCPVVAVDGARPCGRGGSASAPPDQRDRNHAARGSHHFRFL